jgi:hypothetical protein
VHGRWRVAQTPVAGKSTDRDVADGAGGRVAARAGAAPRIVPEELWQAAPARIAAGAGQQTKGLRAGRADVGADAISVAPKDRRDLSFMDLRMATMSGTQAMLTFRENLNSIRSHHRAHGARAR